MSRHFCGIALAFCLANLVACDRGPKIDEDARSAGEIDIDLRALPLKGLKATFHSLRPVSFNCVAGPNSRYENCSMVGFGSNLGAYLLIAQFNVDAPPSDEERPRVICVSTKFRGMLCGQRVANIIAAKEACHYPINVVELYPESNEHLQWIIWDPYKEGFRY